MEKSVIHGHHTGHEVDTSIMKFNLVSTAGPRKSQNQVDVSIKGYGISAADNESPEMEKMIRRLTKNVIKIQKQIQKENPKFPIQTDRVVVEHTKVKKKQLTKKYSEVWDIPEVAVQQTQDTNETPFNAPDSSHIIEHSSSCSNNKLFQSKYDIYRAKSSTGGFQKRCTCSHNDQPTSQICSCKSGNKSKNSSVKSKSIYSSTSSAGKSCSCSGSEGLKRSKKSASKDSLEPCPKTVSRSSTTLKSIKSRSTSKESMKTKSSSKLCCHTVSDQTSEQHLPKKKSGGKKSSKQTLPAKSKSSTKKNKKASKASVAKSKSTHKIEQDCSKVCSDETETPPPVSSKKSLKSKKSKSIKSAHSSAKPSAKSSKKSSRKSSATLTCTDKLQPSPPGSQTNLRSPSAISTNRCTCSTEGKRGSQTKLRSPSATSTNRGSRCTCATEGKRGSQTKLRSPSATSTNRGSRCTCATKGKSPSNASTADLDRKANFMENYINTRGGGSDCSSKNSSSGRSKRDGKRDYLMKYFSCNCDSTKKLDRKSRLVEQHLKCDCKSKAKIPDSNKKNEYLRNHYGCDCRELGHADVDKKMKIVEKSMRCGCSSSHKITKIDEKNKYLNRYMSCGCGKNHDVHDKGKFLERKLKCNCNHSHDKDIELKRNFLKDRVSCACPKPHTNKSPKPYACKTKLAASQPPKTSRTKLARSKTSLPPKTSNTKPGTPRVCGDKLHPGKLRLKLPLNKPGWSDGTVLLCSCGEADIAECRCNDNGSSVTVIKTSPSQSKPGAKLNNKNNTSNKNKNKTQKSKNLNKGDGLICGCGTSNTDTCVCSKLLYDKGTPSKTSHKSASSGSSTADSNPDITINVNKKTKKGDVHMRVVGHTDDQQKFNGHVEMTERTKGKKQPKAKKSEEQLRRSLSRVSSDSKLSLDNINFVECPTKSSSSSNLQKGPKVKKSKSSSSLPTKSGSKLKTSKSDTSPQAKKRKSKSSSPSKSSSKPIKPSTTQTALICHRPNQPGSESSHGGGTAISCPFLGKSQSMSTSDSYECYTCMAHKRSPSAASSSKQKSTVMFADDLESKSKTPFRFPEKKKKKSGFKPFRFLKMFKKKNKKTNEPITKTVTLKKSNVSCHTLYHHV